LVNCAPRAAGFTLVEILVALAVLAIALTATARSLGGALYTTAALRDRTLARWVAEDRLAEIELRREWPDLDVKEGDADMGGRARGRGLGGASRRRVRASRTAGRARARARCAPGADPVCGRSLDGSTAGARAAGAAWSWRAEAS